MTKLKLCPFCGCHPEIRFMSRGLGKENDFLINYVIECHNCHVYFTGETVIGIDKVGQPILKKNGYQECINKWNWRVDND